MDEAQKLKRRLWRVLIKLSRLKIQEWLAITQTIIAALMLWSLCQMHQTLLFTQRQVESSIMPALDIWQGGPILHLKNAGGVTISQMEVLARLAVHYDIRTEKIVDFQLSSVRQMVRQKLNLGQEETLDLSKLALPVKDYAVSVSQGQLEAYCLVLRYRREADLKINYRLIYFYRLKSDSPPDGSDLYFPVGDVNNGVVAGPGSSVPFKNLKLELRNFCLQQLDLPGLEEN
jgi:hypothetical protein